MIDHAVEKFDEETAFEATKVLQEETKKKIPVKKILDIGLFVVMTVGGFFLNYYTSPLTAEGVLASLFFDGGTTPLIIR